MRFNDWPERLAAYIAESEHRRFKWGRFDCCLFVCGAILTMTGVDPARSMRGAYASRKEADDLLFRVTEMKTFDSAIAKMAKAFGFSPEPISLAQRGDLVIVKDETRRKALAIVDLDGRRTVGAGPAGLARLPLDRALKAWRV